MQIDCNLKDNISVASESGSLGSTHLHILPFIHEMCKGLWSEPCHETTTLKSTQTHSDFRGGCMQLPSS